MYTHEISLDSLLRCFTTIMVRKLFPNIQPSLLFLPKKNKIKRNQLPGEMEHTILFWYLLTYQKKGMDFVHSHFHPLVFSKNVGFIYKAGRSCKVREVFRWNSALPGFIQQRPDEMHLASMANKGRLGTTLPFKLNFIQILLHTHFHIIQILLHTTSWS